MASVASQLIEEVTAHAQSDSFEDAREICADGTYFPNSLRINVNAWGAQPLQPPFHRHDSLCYCLRSCYHPITFPVFQVASLQELYRLILCIDLSPSCFNCLLNHFKFPDCDIFATLTVRDTYKSIINTQGLKFSNEWIFCNVTPWSLVESYQCIEFARPYPMLW